MGKTKEGKKEKKVVEEVEMEVEEKKSKKDKKRKVVEAEVEEKEDKKDKKKKKSKKVESEEEQEEEEEETPKKKSKKDKKAKVEEVVEEEEETPKKDKKSKKDNKKKVEESDEEEEEAPKKKSKKEKKEESEEEEEEDTLVIKTKDTKMAAQVAACETTKVFMSNLSFQVDEDSLKAAIESKTGKIVSCKWMEDKETGKFRGSGIIEFDSTEAAGKAVLLNEVEEVLGRAIRVRIWEEKAGNDKKPQREMSARPDNCTTIFCGNLDYNIDDDKMYAFFQDLAEVKQVRWLTDKVSGEFRGCGFVEFYDAESVDKVIVKNGSDLCGRSIRIDYSAPKPRREY